jgi:predicted XRE-type DNA-binding protein
MAKATESLQKDGRSEEEEAVKVTRSSGNVFADLGYTNAEEMLQKSKLVIAISEVMKVKGLNQTKAAEIVGVDQPTLSKLLRGRTRGSTLDRLLGILVLLGQDVEISVRPKPLEVARDARVSVAIAHIL